MIAIINYNMGNLRSVEKAILRLKYPAAITNDPAAISSADKLILPGVGYFKHGMNNLKSLGLIKVLNEQVVLKRKPILGICLGLHLFTKYGEEGDMKGLGWIDAQTLGFSGRISGHIKIPHMGWNNVSVIKNSALTKNIDKDCYFYFAHSYFVQCTKKEDVLMKSNYGMEFVSAISKDNIYGTQFHLEKSHKCGMQILKNFLEI